MKTRKFKRALLGCAAMALLQLSAIAQTGDRVVAPLKGVTALSVYVKPYDAKAQDKQAVQNLAFPMAVLEVEGDFLKVRHAGKTFWIDGAEVSIDKPVDYACVKANPKPGAVAASQGAAKGCQ